MLATHSPVFAAARAEFDGGRGYLAACTVGLPTRAGRAAVVADLDAAALGRPDLIAYSAAVERSRAHFAALVGVGADRVAIGSQTSVAAALVAASLPEGADVLIAEGDFSSIVLPFVHSGRGLNVRTAPLERLADEIRPATALVVFSIVQSATGVVADADAILASAETHGTRTLCDATQAVGWMRVEASRFDAVICHTYKWLCAPRGVSFLTVSSRLERDMPALFAGWYAGADPWVSCYGGGVELAPDASRFDVSPAWQAFVGAEPALALFASLPPDELHAHSTRLAGAFRERLGIELPERQSAIVTWEDPDGVDLVRLTTSGVVASGRAGRARVAFHLFNDDEDVEAALTALGR
ncbi:aminotransferase class V-fold PLP-dependent enzyme [Microbacterium sp. CFBP9034]|uniref:aminotransferase class V-fold PLP-dependent enzyme n=1 Tax=Microbacterium sp. CFBP9034 TaxID=3096540 RepID=UPI002A6AA253|nr:aminotransferase class V-fold PLP-dependent enzyme [Microbacterium sp. CFBP9034]MDY0909440.1 aminotransferase class V-fold PLP-dependent enzyme [Microbacterium sp. CFBP9034]